MPKERPSDASSWSAPVPWSFRRFCRCGAPPTSRPSPQRKILNIDPSNFVFQRSAPGLWSFRPLRAGSAPAALSESSRGLCSLHASESVEMKQAQRDRRESFGVRLRALGEPPLWGARVGFSPRRGGRAKLASASEQIRALACRNPPPKAAARKASQPHSSESQVASSSKQASYNYYKIALFRAVTLLSFNPSTCAARVGCSKRPSPRLVLAQNTIPRGAGFGSQDDKGLGTLSVPR